MKKKFTISIVTLIIILISTQSYASLYTLSEGESATIINPVEIYESEFRSIDNNELVYYTRVSHFYNETIILTLDKINLEDQILHFNYTVVYIDNGEDNETYRKRVSKDYVPEKWYNHTLTEGTKVTGKFVSSIALSELVQDPANPIPNVFWTGHYNRRINPDEIIEYSDGRIRASFTSEVEETLNQYFSKKLWHCNEPAEMDLTKKEHAEWLKIYLAYTESVKNRRISCLDLDSNTTKRPICDDEYGEFSYAETPCPEGTYCLLGVCKGGIVVDEEEPVDPIVKTEPEPEIEPACPEDTKLCDDRTIVVRVPPDCEFEECPVIESDEPKKGFFQAIIDFFKSIFG